MQRSKLHFYWSVPYRTFIRSLSRDGSSSYKKTCELFEMMSSDFAKSPQNDRNCQRHRDMYKSPPMSGYWKETYRQRCKERVRNARHNLHLNFRHCQPAAKDSFVSNLMEEELSYIHTEYADITPEEVGEMMEVIRHELQEQRFVQEYEALQAEMDSFDNSGVICPICKKNFLAAQQGTVIVCPCGMRLRTESEVSLTRLHTYILHALQVHQETCEFEPTFTLCDIAAATNLLLVCRVCDLMYTII